MRRISLGVPGPIPSVRPVTDCYEYHISERSVLDIPVEFPRSTIVDVLENRRTRRTFGPLSRSELSKFLWLVSKDRPSDSTDLSYPKSSRPHPTSGGLHCIDLVLLEGPLASTHCKLYDALKHELCDIEIPRPESLAELKSEANGVVPLQGGILFCLAAQVSVLSSFYQNPESLVWRDSGIILGTMALVAESLSLNFCPLGITGEPHVSSAFRSVGILECAGLAIVGSRP